MGNCGWEVGSLLVWGSGKWEWLIKGDWYVSATESFPDFSIPIFGNIPSYTLQKKQYKTNYIAFLLTYTTQSVKTWYLCTMDKMKNIIIFSIVKNR